MNIVLIDGDFIPWKICPLQALSETEIMYGVSNEKTWEDIQKGINWYMEEKIIKPTNADVLVGYLGGKGNYRKEISPDYKADRVDKAMPPLFKEAKQHLVERWEFRMVDGIEAEDAVGITLTEYPEAIIVGQDHDLYQLPGTHYNPVTGSWRTITPEEAKYNLSLQLITGCKTDKVPGLKKGIGEVKGAKLLAEGNKYHRITAIDLYCREYGAVDGIRLFKENFKLLKILREKEGFEVPKIQVNVEPSYEF